MKFPGLLFSTIVKTDDNNLFEDIVGCDDIKQLFRMVLHADSALHILLVGPPASAKTMFLTSLMRQVKNSYFTDGGNSTKAGMIGYVFENRPKYLLIDELDKMDPKDQAVLLNLMETGMVTETKSGKTRSTQVKTYVFATSNNTKKVSAPLQSRFFIVEVEPYRYEQFCDITNELLSSHNIDEGVSNMIAYAVWNKSRDVRDCVKIGKIARTMKDAEFIVDKFFQP
ncbi:MAG: AAA family ATPase [Candidatus Nitrosopolaris sp.]